MDESRKVSDVVGNDDIPSGSHSGILGVVMEAGPVSSMEEKKKIPLMKDHPESSKTYGQNSPSSMASNDDLDRDFEYSVESLSGDYDDEETIDVEEADDDGEGDADELSDLAKEGEMPLEELLARYYNKQDDASDSSSPENQKSSSNDDEVGSKPEDIDSDDSAESTRQLRSNTAFLTPTQSDSGSEENDQDYIPPVVDDWKKAPRVGEEFQADFIPERSEQEPDYDTSTDELIWDPASNTQEEVKRFLLSVGGIPSSDGQSLNLSSETHLRDNEDALFLLNQCNNDVTEAIRRFKMRPPPLSSELEVWSEEECRQFEHGLSLYGKNFHVIHHNKVKTKSIGEIVKFYYIWKKSNRFDHFNAKTRLGKKKDPFHPSDTDYMERLLDETEHAMSSHHCYQPGTTSSLPAMSHGNALQQHIVDISVMKKQNRPQHPTTWPQSSNNEYFELNGFVGEGEYTDDIDMFDIVPTIPANHIYPPVPFASLDPAIHVGYSDPGHLAPISSGTAHAEVVPVSSGLANCNNNSRIGTVSAHEANLLPRKHDRQLLESAATVPYLECESTVEITHHNSTLPLDVLSSIDELENAYCSPSSSTSVSQTSTQSSSQDSLYVDSPKEGREITTLKLKRFHSSGNEDSGCNDTKRRRTDDSDASSGDNSLDTALAFPRSPHFNVDRLPSASTITSHASSSTSYQVTTANELSRDGVSDPSSILSC